jgi:hypothetical protein
MNIERIISQLVGDNARFIEEPIEQPGNAV